MLDASGAISHVLHGSRPVSDPASVYTPSDADRLAQLMRSGKKDTEFVCWSTYFDVPSAPAFAALVDRLDAEGAGSPAAYSQAHEHVMDALDFNFRSEHFSARKVK